MNVHGRIRLVAALAASALASSGRAGESCGLIPNGSFDDGDRGWLFTPEETAGGDAFTTTSAEVFDGTTYGAGFDSSVLGIFVAASAGFGGGTGAAEAEGRVATIDSVTGRSLRVRRGGGFEFQFNGQGARSLVVEIRVSGPGTAVATAVLYQFATPGGSGCFPALSVLGTLDAFPPEIELDLFAAGIELGDKVEIAAIVRATASATEDCQWTDTQAFLIVDDFEFCNDPCAGDFDASGTIGFSDLSALLAAWGACPSCPEDLDASGAVGFSDLSLLLNDWGPC